jgi:large conductance mechanosensitive channel
MPLVSLIIPANQDYVHWKLILGAKEVPYGLFIGEIVNFMLISIVLFIFIVKFLGHITKFKEKEAAAPPPPTKDQELLMEIRDLLRDNKPTIEL